MGHLDAESVAPMFYAVRWLTSMLTQDLEMPDVLRAWDALLGDLEGPRPLLQFLCAARILVIRDALLNEDGAGCLDLLQRGGYPPGHLEEALQLSERLREGNRPRKSSFDFLVDA